LVSKISLVATGDVRVLLTGETGSGKELAARAIHSMGRRRKKPFVTVNCGAIPRDLVESELFGHNKGAFTGAHEDRKGCFEEAHGGTLFLDEVAELSPVGQTALLRVLEEGMIRRVGASKSIPVDVRVVAATHRNLREVVRSGLFREDLLHRIAVVEIRVPPLRERRGDIGLIARHMIVELSQRMGRRPPALSRDVITRLVAYQWPGNVRELRNALENALIRSQGQELRVEHLALGEESVETAVGSTMAEMEKRHIAEVMASCGGNKVQAAKVLKISRSTLYEKIKSLGIE
ncbi:MAG: sigma-54 interaction domain-containing protein, partial [Planctomycetota bacterium]